MNNTNYKDIDQAIKEELEIIVQEDKHGLSAESLYANISNSSGPIEMLAEIFEVPISLVVRIKDTL